jgi:uncharacterized protein YmfQ (DUF2313 family)
MDKFLQSLTYLLPPGFAWPRDPDATLMRVMRGIAGTFDELHRFTHRTVFEWQPGTTTTRLFEWEEATGLPDTCFGTNQTEETRRHLLSMRLRGPVLPYENSSPASPAVIESMCLSAGYVATVAYNTPMRAGMRVGRALGRLDGELYVTAVLPSGRLRVGVGRAGDRLIYGTKTGSDLRCLLGRTLPARFHLNLILT